MPTNEAKNQGQTKGSFIQLNRVTIVMFTLAGACLWIDGLITFLTKFETELPVIIIAAMFYLPAKWCLYFILYLRLKLVLKDSQFAYSDKHYLKIRIAIWLSIFSGITAAISSTILLEAIVAFSSGSLFLLLDIIIPLWLNIMFIYKFFQIGKFVILTRQQLSINKNKLNMNDIPPTTNGSITNNNNNNSHNINSKTSAHGDGNYKLNLLLQRVSKFSILSLIIAISSITCLGVFIAQFIIIGTNDTDNVLPITVLTIQTDSCINVVCLVLYFPFAKWIAKRCLCNGGSHNGEFCCACLLSH